MHYSDPSQPMLVSSTQLYPTPSNRLPICRDICGMGSGYTIHIFHCDGLNPTLFNPQRSTAHTQEPHTPWPILWMETSVEKGRAMHYFLHPSRVALFPAIQPHSATHRNRQVSSDKRLGTQRKCDWLTETDRANSTIVLSSKMLLLLIYPWRESQPNIDGVKAWNIIRACFRSHPHNFIIIIEESKEQSQSPSVREMISLFISSFK